MCVWEDLCVLDFLVDASLHRHFAICGVGVGRPRPLRCSDASVPWVSLLGPAGVPSDAQAR